MSFIERPLNAPTNPTPGGFTLNAPDNTVDDDDATQCYVDGTSIAVGTEIDYVFESPFRRTGDNEAIFISKIVFKKTKSNEGRITIDDFETTWGPIAGNTFVHVPINQEFDSISKLSLFLETQSQTAAESRVFDVKIHGYFRDYNFEFNDSVLETKGWNSSRYNGRQLSSAKRNEFTKGDITYGKTPVVERYTRNIYIGNDVINLDPSHLEDPSLLPINNFSYLQSNYYITVNENGSITHNRLEKTKTNNSQKTGFYQAFYDDFPEGSTCNIVLFDDKVKNNLKSSYKIYFNGGQLQQLWSYGSLSLSSHPANTSHKIEYIKDYNITRIWRKLGGAAALQVIVAYFTVPDINKHIIRDFYSGDLNIIGDGNNSIEYNITPKKQGKVYDSAFEYKNTSDYKGNKRFFMSYVSYDNAVVRTLATGSIPTSSNTPLDTQNLGELSTIEIFSASLDPDDPSFPKYITLHGVEKNPLNQDYNTQFSDLVSWPQGVVPPPIAIEEQTPPDVRGLTISKVTDDVPSLLVNLNKITELRSGGGDFPFVLIPSNLHPYIKDNLKLYLSKAGINVGGDATQTIDEIITNKPRKPRLTPGVRKAITRGRRRRLQLEEESNRNRRQRERQNRRKKRKQNREDRKENRQETRQNRRNNRKERRENRRNRRRNR